MALKTLKPKVGMLAPRLKRYAPGDEAGRDAARVGNEPWRKWYRIRRWRDIRMKTFVRDLFTCRICGKLEGDTSKLVCDHVDPHHGNEELFWSGPFQTLCNTCHSSVKQKQERRAW